jgi:hypothetical protein
MLLLAVPGLSAAQTLKNITHQPPDGAFLSFLLTDGRVLVQGNSLTDWWTLTPDQTGSYLNGTWQKVGSLPSGYAPDAAASEVLADGRVVLVGGEYNFGNFVLTNLGAIFDPVANTWTNLPPPIGFTWIGDSPSAVLPNGKFLFGDKLNMKMAELDPATLTWKTVPHKGKKDFDAEEGWTLLPDGSILTFDVKDAPNAERYYPNLKQWLNAGNTIVDLHSPYQGGGCIGYGGLKPYCPPGEVGPAILRPNGTVFATGSFSKGGGAGHTSVYSPSSNSWTVGPDFPNGDNAGDSFACLLPSGNVLVAGNSGTFYEFDGTNFKQTLIGYGSLLVLPTGQVAVGFGNVALYTPAGTYSPAWAPTISSFPSSVTRGSTYQISGTQFNGLSQAAAFGDEYQTNTNYPLVRITNNATGHVFYARTHGHSTMGVATGSATVSTNFDVPSGMETGPSSLVVVANGIPSAAVSVTVN